MHEEMRFEKRFESGLGKGRLLLRKNPHFGYSSFEKKRMFDELDQNLPTQAHCTEQQVIAPHLALHGSLD